MLFFRRRDTLQQSNLTDRERCIHACVFFAFIFLILTSVLFYFAANTKTINDQRLYYYIGASICLVLLLSIIFCTVVGIRRVYGSSIVSQHQHPHQQVMARPSERSNSRSSNYLT